MITKKQKFVLDFINEYQKQNGYAPSLEEIRIKFKLASVSTAHHHVKKLENEGLIYKEVNQPRALATKKVLGSIEIPILGTIAAGQPIEAMETRGESIVLSKWELPTNDKHYALKVTGESMIEDGIFDGDIVVITIRLHLKEYTERRMVLDYSLPIKPYFLFLELKWKLEVL